MMERIPQEWFRRAKNETDPYYKFMSIYMALNFLYNFDRIGTERERMCKYLCNEAKEHSYQWKPASNSEFIKSPVVDMKYMKEYPVKKGDLESLFKAIYTVRCNLFHGNKMLGDVRDKALVEEAANILIEILSSELEIADC